MNNYVLKLNQGQQVQLKKNFGAKQISSKNPYVDFAARLDGVTVILYTSSKVVFQGPHAKELASKYGFIEEDIDDIKSDTITHQDMPMIGTDEVGNGSYFGGLAVVASYVEPEQHDLLKQLGVGDSKQLTDSRIRQLAPILKEKIQHKSLLLFPEKYNQLVGDGKPYNAVSIKVALHNQAIFLLLQQDIKPQKIVIDAFTSLKNYRKYESLEKNHFSNPLTLEEKAEGKYLAVAVSSIIARDLFLENLDNLGKKVGLILPSGAGNKSDLIACQLLKSYGLTGLEKTAKLHFANTKKAINLSKQ